MAKQPRVRLPKKASAGEVFQVKTLAYHDMETGNRKDKDGNKLPRLILNKFMVTLNGKEVFSADFFTSVSKNPILSFYLTAEESGTYAFTWTDDNGETISVSEDITVS